MTRVAHVVTAGPLPAGALWAAATLACAAGVAAFAAGPGRRRALLAALAVAAAGAGVAAVVIAGSAPARPFPALAVVMPANRQATSPLALRVCATSASGAAADVVADGRVVEVLVDGTVVSEGPDTVLHPTVTPGHHTVSVEVVAADHRRFAPPLTADTTVEVSGPGPLLDPPRCGG